MSSSAEEVIHCNLNRCSSSKSSECMRPSTIVRSSRMSQRKSHQGGNMAARLSSSADVRQRVQSARINRFKTLQNQLAEAIQLNSTLINENRLLKTLHKYQDNALAKYEGSQAKLPQLINSHSEELRVCQTKYKTLSSQHKELNQRMVAKDKIINDLSDRVKHLTRLNSDKNLEERETLTAKVQSLERQLKEKDEELRIMTRRNVLEAKNFRVQLLNEKKKFKEICEKFERNPLKPPMMYETERMSVKEMKQLTGKSAYADYKRQGQHDNHSKNGKRKSQCSSNSTDGKSSVKSELIAFGDTDDDDDDDLVIGTVMDDKNQMNAIAQELADLSIGGDGKMNFQNFQNKIRDDIDANERFLDEHCDELRRGILNGSDGNISLNGSGLNPKRSPIDPQKKSKLLAALKSIDALLPERREVN